MDFIPIEITSTFRTKDDNQLFEFIKYNRKYHKNFTELTYAILPSSEFNNSLRDIIDKLPDSSKSEIKKDIFYALEYFHAHNNSYINSDVEGPLNSTYSNISYLFSFNLPHYYSYTIKNIATKYGEFKSFSFEKNKIKSHPLVFIESLFNSNSNKNNETIKFHFNNSLNFISFLDKNYNNSLSQPALFSVLKKFFVGHQFYSVKTNQHYSAIDFRNPKEEKREAFLRSQKYFQDKYFKQNLIKIKQILNSDNYQFLSPFISIPVLYKFGYFVLSEDIFTPEEQEKLLKNTHYIFEGHKKSRIYSPILNTLSNLVNSLYYYNYNSLFSGNLSSVETNFLNKSEKMEILNDFIKNPLVIEMLNDEVLKLINTPDYMKTEPFLNYQQMINISNEIKNFFEENLTNIHNLLSHNSNEIIYQNYLNSPNSIMEKNIKISENTLAFQALFNQAISTNIPSLYFSKNIDEFYKIDKLLKERDPIIEEGEYLLKYVNSVIDKNIEDNNEISLTKSDQLIKLNTYSVLKLWRKSSAELHAYELHLSLEKSDKVKNQRKKI